MARVFVWGQATLHDRGVGKYVELSAPEAFFRVCPLQRCLQPRTRLLMRSERAAGFFRFRSERGWPPWMNLLLRLTMARVFLFGGRRRFATSRVGACEAPSAPQEAVLASRDGKDRFCLAREDLQ